MSNGGAIRRREEPDRASSASFSARSKVLPTRVGVRDMKDPILSSSDVIPEDSASNVSGRKAASRGRKVNGVNIYTHHQAETTRHTTHDRLHVRQRSPLHSNGSIDREKAVQLPRQESNMMRGSDPRISRKPESSWKPQASLIPHTSAPLAPRVSRPVHSTSFPKALEPESLDRMTSDRQESAILEDLLFVFMGYEGQYIRFADKYDPLLEKDRLAGPTYRILPGLDPSLRDLTTSVLKMSTYYSSMEAFVEIQSRDEFGAINHALCASIAKSLKEYLVLIAQLEHQMITNPSFTLHKLHLYTLPISHVMFQLYTLAQEISKRNSSLEDDLDDSVDGFDDVDHILEQLREGGDLAPGSMAKKVCKGGSVLRLLTERLAFMSGDPAARSLLQTLLRDASKPYMVMLNEWLHHGGIKDPHAEFLIKEQQSIKRERLEEDYTDEYWEKRYTVRDNDIPPQLEGVKDKVLLAGKYLNVVRECGGVDISKDIKDVPKSFDDPQFLDNVNSAYAYANSSLLNLLLTTHALPARLRSMKHYFFLDRSDFLTYFLDLSASELRKPSRLVNVSKLQSLLDLVLRQPGTVAAQDPFKEEVKVHMNSMGLTDLVMRVVNVKGLDEATAQEQDTYRTPATKASSTADDDKEYTGFKALELKFFVPFPLSLVVSSKTVFRYQILFRYLLSMRHLEGLLVNSWEDHIKVLSWIQKSGDRKLEMWKRKAWTLRARMLVFLQQTTYYCTSEVIEPNWQALMARVNGDGRSDGNGRPGSGAKAPRTVDELMEDHVDFLDTCLKECMLMNSKLLKIHSKLTFVCNAFATYTASLSRTLFTCSPALAGSPASIAYLTANHYPGGVASSHDHSTNTHTSSSNASSKRTIPEELLKYNPAKLDNLYEMLGKYEQNFEHHLRLLLDALDYYAATETVALSRLCAVLGSAMGGGRDEGRRDARDTL